MIINRNNGIIPPGSDFMASYNLLQEKINEMGDIKKIVSNEDILKEIIAFDGDRHLLCALFEKVNENIENGYLTDEDLKLFRSGKLADLIVNLSQVTNEKSYRVPYRNERLDKLNYISLIKDEETLAMSYTHPEILAALADIETHDSAPLELIWWSECGTFSTLPPRVQASIVSEVLKRGNALKARILLSEMKGDIKRYPLEERYKPIKRM